ncbi:MAG: hypothetical protein ACP5UQ_11750 [Anaerolineae bacterium]
MTQPRNRPADDSVEVLKYLALTRSTLRRFKEQERARLDPWEATSLAVAEQALERAWLALSQLHADLQGPPRRA